MHLTTLLGSKILYRIFLPLGFFEEYEPTGGPILLSISIYGSQYVLLEAWI